mmetsp:Transcript_33619/g.41177  ORF Transcript_33619/g.41177 Transcript_33619/m.41177 type:complete len:336 (-) Transcript_33619:94-1101(-)|eukprot:CAMPEP_0172503454 /NCGR_PEP_ID=MMETSP1066-20121228/169233_1 /TAXON_ID=671091 /ORGANISM="Coscinodiscus wailesii, Strain CCMP2513" /LENGTH=335 /DNA_ID=CAMNT_0013279193 /DNA_START=132 /DNA_END=1139 /DNA_ORIENTATION=-
MLQLRSPFTPLLLVLAILNAVTTSSQTNIGFESFDTDHNGQISREEYANAVNLIGEALNSGLSGHTPPKIDAVLPSVTGEKQKSKTYGAGGGGGPGRKFVPAFINSLSMIIATEIGDKTFFIAAVMSMRNDRRAVFAGAILALYIMTILSSMMGLVLPSLVPRQYTHIIGGILFLYFGIRLMVDSRSMSDGKCSDELEEVEEELLHKGNVDKKKEEKLSPDDDEADVENASAPSSGQRNIAKENTHWERVLIQSLTLTFVAEWGDRSQIATIALAAAKDPYGVNIGAMVGHTICTGMAVIGGRILAASISEKTVSLWGGVIFLVFGIHSLFFEEL